MTTYNAMRLHALARQWCRAGNELERDEVVVSPERNELQIGANEIVFVRPLRRRWERKSKSR
jgi:hypothetical protein